MVEVIKVNRIADAAKAALVDANEEVRKKHERRLEALALVQNVGEISGFLIAHGAPPKMHDALNQIWLGSDAARIITED